MILVGQSLAVPGRTVYEDIDGFRAMGLDGIEVVCRANSDFDGSIDSARAVRMADYAGYNGLPIVAIASIAGSLGQPGAQGAMARRQVRRAVELADLMRARVVRASVAAAAAGAAEDDLAEAVAALRDVGAVAADRGITLVVEASLGTLAWNGAATRRVLAAVASPAVLALYDPARVLRDTGEAWQATLAALAGSIAYVQATGVVQSDAGGLPWPALLRGLLALGYAGALSLGSGELPQPADPRRAEAAVVAGSALLRETLASLGLAAPPSRCRS